FVFFLWSVQCVFAQQPDASVIHAQQAQDTLIMLDSNVVKQGWFSKDYPNPKKAALLSLVVPGAGQVYNKGIWYVKVPIIYGAIGGVVYAIDLNQSRYRRFKKAYSQKLRDEDTEFKGLPFDNERSLKILRDYYDKNTQLSYIGLVAVYALQSVEAFVHAHLKTFDVNDDLSLRLKPQLNTDLLTGAPTPAIGLVIQFE
ncbi:MAG: DUF5683 domain-containing protein, partial [Saprospiraceae bacterium]|nr:DUF5683 domain-containing protein [Saprospiraceae bacterium]